MLNRLCYRISREEGYVKGCFSLATYQQFSLDSSGECGLYFEHKNLRSGFVAQVVSLNSRRANLGDSQRGRERRGRLTVRQRSPYPKFGERGRGRHPKNSSRQFQVGLHIITSLQRFGGPRETEMTVATAKAQNASSKLFPLARPQDICFFRNTQKMTFMGAIGVGNR